MAVEERVRRPGAGAGRARVPSGSADDFQVRGRERGPHGGATRVLFDERDQGDSLDQAAAAFVGIRPRLFGIAYRMLASATEAEDIVQETWLRWQGAERSVITNPAAFLALITTRLSINAARSARARHETGIASPLPEPIDTGADPAAGVERAEALERALLLLLENLTPAQRAAYILREAFDYPYAQIAEIIGLSPANVRQLVSRARRHLDAPRRVAIRAGEHRRLLSTFLDAAHEGNMRALEGLFAADVLRSSGISPDPVCTPSFDPEAVRSRRSRQLHRLAPRDSSREQPGDRRPPSRRPLASPPSKRSGDRI